MDIHTWSLSIEIQYYILFGLFSLIIFNLRINQNLKLIKILLLLLLPYLFYYLYLLILNIFLITFRYQQDYGNLCWVHFYILFILKKYPFNKIFIIFLFILSALNFLTLDYKLIIVCTLLFTFLILLYSEKFN